MSKEQRVTTNLVDLSKPALWNFLSIPPLTDISMSPSSQPKASWNSRLLLPFGVFCLQVLPFPWEGPGVWLGRKGIPWPLLLSSLLLTFLIWVILLRTEVNFWHSASSSILAGTIRMILLDFLCTAKVTTYPPHPAVIFLRVTSVLCDRPRRLTVVASCSHPLNHTERSCK